MTPPRLTNQGGATPRYPSRGRLSRATGRSIPGCTPPGECAYTGAMNTTRQTTRRVYRTYTGAKSALRPSWARGDYTQTILPNPDGEGWVIGPKGAGDE